MKHTPGPWEYCQANPEQGCSCGLVWSKPCDCVVAEITFKDEDHTKPHEAAIANAKLIAAAPDLYEALEYLMFYVGDVLGEKENSESYIMAKRAIAKATE